MVPPTPSLGGLCLPRAPPPMLLVVKSTPRQSTEICVDRLAYLRITAITLAALWASSGADSYRLIYVAHGRAAANRLHVVAAYWLSVD